MNFLRYFPLFTVLVVFFGSPSLALLHSLHWLWIALPFGLLTGVGLFDLFLSVQ